ncbi:MAG: transglycosylase SLT domain-containing protein [Nocardioides sp.]|uniref:peptidoglycan-binding domain-containing protein n=1 Tax=Nocardioides sp. TaxID=35761 RepID=UPI0032669771
MSFMGADTDALREAGQECQEGKEKTDQVIQYLRMLIMALRAASFFTGGASAAYAEYLESTVVPWLQRISQALGLMAQVLMSNADDQDGVSDSRSQLGGTGAALSYASPGAERTMQPIGVWEGSLTPATVAPGTTSETGSSISSPGSMPSASTDVASGSWATDDHVGTLSQSALTGSPIGGQTGSWDGSSGAGSPTISTGGAIGGGAGSIGDGAGSSGGSAGGTGGGSGSSGLGASSIGGTPDSGAGASSTGLSSYSNDNLAGLGGGTPDSGANPGEAGLGTAVTDRTTGETTGSYGAVAGVAGGAAALGLGGAALAGRSGSQTDKRINELGAQNGRGSRGEGVTELQQKLTAAGFDTLGTDGVWGRNTQAAYDAYRQANPLAIQHGSGYTSPAGFDYTKIAHVQGNRHVTPEFLRGVEGVAQRLGTKPEYLLTAMSYESGFNPRADNPRSTAFGLIQFMRDTRADLGVTQEQLSRMTAAEQLPYVEKYFERHRGQLNSLESVYTTIFAGHPASPGEVLYERGSDAYRVNSQFDINRDGRLTAAEATTVVRRNLRD